MPTHFGRRLRHWVHWIYFFFGLPSIFPHLISTIGVLLRISEWRGIIEMNFIFHLMTSVFAFCTALTQRCSLKKVLKWCRLMRPIKCSSMHSKNVGIVAKRKASTIGVSASLEPFWFGSENIRLNSTTLFFSFEF